MVPGVWYRVKIIWQGGRFRVFVNGREIEGFLMVPGTEGRKR